MNKKLIALAVAGALGAPLVASAAPGDGVTLFGRVGAEYGSTKIDQVSTNAGAYRQETIGDNTGVSRYGLRIVEDLGNGLKANAQIEFAFRTGTGVADFAREQWIGLSGQNWGALQFGRVNAPFKDFAGGTNLDPFNHTNIQARGIGGAMYAPGNGFGAGGFVDHAIRYNSPSWGPFSMALLASPGDATQTDPVPGGGGNIGGKGGTSNYQVALKYKFGTAGEIFGGYSNDEASDAQAAAVINGRTADDEQVWRLGTAWNFGNFRIAGQYDRIKNALANNGGTTCAGGAIGNGGGDTGISTAQCNTALNTNGDGDIWFLTTQYKIGKTTLVLQGGETKGDSIGTSVERESKNLTAGAIYSLSKRTRVFGGYQRVSIEGAGNTAGVGVVGNAVNTTAAQAAAAVQPDRETWTIGMRHDF